MSGYERNAEGKIVGPEPAPAAPKDYFVADSLEVILRGSQGDTRQARRRFYRLVQKHWPLTFDPARHTRLKGFVEQYAALEAGGLK
jgi:hypothetical protein